MKFTLVLLAILSLSTGVLYAQPTPKTLLWRISGKDGHQVSYLYGTFHLTDSRIFNLGDSLYEAIHSTDGLAIEIDPAELTNFVLDEVKKQITNTKNIKDMLSEKDYKTYGPLLSKKLKKPQKDITTADVLREKNKWMQDAYRKGSMQTFLDIYLYDIARRQNKWTGGVEDMDDQRDLVNDIVDKSDIKEVLVQDSAENTSALEGMLSAYVRQDLDAINSITNNNGEEDPIMLRRNKKMSLRMDSLSALRKMVFAVGAAHLPGEHGLIRLLREKGFTVEPVFSSKKINASDYKVQEVPMSWKDFTDEHGWYQASMPGKAADMNAYGVLNMKLYIDLFEGVGYFVTATPSVFGEDKADSLYDQMAKRMFKSAREYQKITIQGARGRSYSVNEEDGYKNALFLAKDGMLYLLMAASTKDNEVVQKNIHRFFDSFKILATHPKEEAKTYRFTDSALAYTVETPATSAPYTGPRNESNDWSSRLFLSMDVAQGMYYFFGVNTIARGRFVENDSSFLHTLKKTSLEKLSSVSSDTIYYSNDRMIAEISGQMKEANMLMTCRFIMRGNRWHALLVMRPLSSSTEKQEQFFRSFDFLNYPAHTWASSMAPDSAFSAWVPSPLVISPFDSTDGESIDIKYNSFDSSRSNTYSVIGYHLSPYFWSLSDSAFWAQRVNGHVGYSDSVLYKKPVSNGEIRGWEFMKVQRGSHMYQRQRILLYGNRLYSVYLCAPEQDARSADADRFFEDIRFLTPPPPTRFFDCKAKLLLEHLYDADSARRARARSYLTEAPFTATDLPLLHQALLQDNKVDWELSSEDLQRTIIKIKDSSSFRLAADSYTRTPGSSDALKVALLNIMASFPNAGHFAEMAALLRNSPPKDKLGFIFSQALTDTMSLTKDIIPQLLPLLNDSLIGPSILDIAVPLLDSAYITLQQLVPYEKKIQAWVPGRIHVMVKDPDDYTNRDLYLIRMLTFFNDPKSNLLLRKFLTIHNNYIKVKAIDGLLKNKQPLDPTVYLPMAANKADRVDLYTAMEKNGKASLFPLAYRSQRMLAEALVYNNAMEDADGEKVTVRFINTRIYTDTAGIKRKAYFFKVKMEGSEGSYLACAAPFDIDPTHLGTKDTETRLNYSKSLDTKHLSQQMEELLKEFLQPNDRP